MFVQAKVKEGAKNCPQCGYVMEWLGGKTDKTSAELVCQKCRIWVEIKAMTGREQEEYATIEAFQ